MFNDNLNKKVIYFTVIIILLLLFAVVTGWLIKGKSILLIIFGIFVILILGIGITLYIMINFIQDGNKKIQTILENIKQEKLRKEDCPVAHPVINDLWRDVISYIKSKDKHLKQNLNNYKNIIDTIPEITEKYLIIFSKIKLFFEKYNTIKSKNDKMLNDIKAEVLSEPELFNRLITLVVELKHDFDIFTKIEDTDEIFKKLFDIKEFLQTSIKKYLFILQGLENHVQVLKDTAVNAENIAINTSIMVGRLGNEGYELGILCEDFQLIAEKFQKIVDEYDKTYTTLKDIDEIAEEKFDLSSINIVSFKERINKFNNTYDKLNETINEKLNELQLLLTNTKNSFEKVSTNCMLLESEKNVSVKIIIDNMNELNNIVQKTNDNYKGILTQWN